MPGEVESTVTYAVLLIAGLSALWWLQLSGDFEFDMLVPTPVVLGVDLGTLVQPVNR